MQGEIVGEPRSAPTVERQTLSVVSLKYLNPDPKTFLISLMAHDVQGRPRIYFALSCAGSAGGVGEHRIIYARCCAICAFFMRDARRAAPVA